MTTAATEQGLDGNVDAVIVLDDDRLLARVVERVIDNGSALAVGSTRLVEWRLSTRTARTWFSVSGYSLTEPVLAADGLVYVGDRGSEAMHRPSGMHAFDPATGTETATRPGSPMLSPYDLIAAP